MTRFELRQAVARKHSHLSFKEIERIVDVFFDEISQHLADGGRIELRGFGTFSTRQRDPRIGRNPRTGETVQVSGRRFPYFKPGKEVRDQLNTDQSLQG